MSFSGAELKAARWIERAHLNFGKGGYGYDYACSLDDRVVVKIRRPKAREQERRVIVVGAEQFEWTDWEGAAAALAKLGD